VKTEDLIAKLSAESVPVAVLPPAVHRLARWAAWSAPAVVLFVLAAGPRADLMRQLASRPFLLSLGAIVGLMTASAYAALTSTVPNDERSPTSRFVPIVVLATWGGVLLAKLAGNEGVLTGLRSDSGHMACALQISLMALVPAVILLREARAGASVEPGRTGVLVIMAAASAGAVGAALICPIDQSAHQLLWHFLPVVSLAACGPAAGHRWLGRFDRA
jgi:hypothetical protein